MLKGYGKYKISNSYFGIKIPYEWDESKILHLFDIVSDKNHGNEELLSVYLNKGVVKYSSTSQMQVHKPSEDLSNYQLVKPGDFVLNNQQAWRGSVGVSKFRGIISPAYYILRPRKDINSAFLNYIVRGYSLSDIAQKLCLSVKTISTYKTRIMTKLNCKQNSDLVNYALKNNILDKY